MSDLPENIVNTIICGDALQVMAGWPDGCVDSCVTSPPYWGLRDYGIPASDWPEVTFCPMPGLPPMTIPAETSVHGLEKNIWSYVAHEVLVFREVRRVLADDGTLWLNLGDSYSRNPKKGGSGPNGKHDYIPSYGDARRIMSESLGSSDGFVGRADRAPVRMGGDGLKEKDLCGIPWRVAYALQADGWWWRSSAPWLKRNPMPESCEDRPTSAVEQVFLFSKSKTYYWDTEGVKRSLSDASVGRITQESFDEQTGGPKDYGHRTNENRSARKALCNLKEKLVSQEKWGDRHEGWKQRDPGCGRNLRNSDWFWDSWQGLLIDGDGGPLAFVVNPQGTDDAHFATFPEKLVEPMILAGCPKQVCTVCGKARERIVERQAIRTKGIGPNSRMLKNRDPAHPENRNRNDEWDTSNLTGKTVDADDAVVAAKRIWAHTKALRAEGMDHDNPIPPRNTLGWTDCGHNSYRPGRVLDCFGGSGTVGYVAAKLKRDYVLIDLNPKYVQDIAQVRLQEAEVGLPREEARAGQLPLFSQEKTV